MNEVRCENGEVILSGQFSFVLWPKGNIEKDTFMIARYNETGTGNQFVASGTNLPIDRDVDYKLRGSWKATERGTSLRVSSFEMLRPSSKRGFVSYMRALKCGIGPDRATRIYEKFGEQIWNVLDYTPQRLMEVRGITANTLDRLLKKLEDTKVERELSSLFGTEQISGQKIYKIHEKLGPNAVKILKNNPFVLCSFDGFGFRTADRLARKLGTDPTLPDRLAESIQYLFDEYASNGHTCVPSDVFLERLYNELNRDYSGAPVPRQLMQEALKTAFARQEIRASKNPGQDTVYLYSSPRYDQEQELAKGLGRLLSGKAEPVGDIEPFIREYEQEVGMTMADSQRTAVQNAFRYQVNIITGGAGTGKTTTLRAILFVHQKVFGDKSQPILMAPTGRAASRMTEATGVPAATVHSLIAFRGESEREDNQRLDPDGKLDGNLFIVDECSMMDLFISQALVRKIPSEARLIFVGDPGQLPSVGCGNVLYDMIASGVVPTSKLNVIFRQANENPIVYNSTQIRQGRMDLLEAPQFAVREGRDTESIFRQACSLYCKAVDRTKLDDVMLLCPYRSKSDLNVDRFNRKLQELINPARTGDLSMKKGSMHFRPRDRVMQMKNTEEAHNGDIGVILRIDEIYDPDTESHKKIAAIEFNGDGVEHYYDENMIYELDLAYCTTIHKAQGSEAPIVIVVLSEQHSIALRRPLIYTGVTRSKTNFILVTDWGRKAWNDAIANDSTDARWTMLSQRLRAVQRKA